MTEPVMYFGIGFFIAAVLGLLILLHVHGRATRLNSVDRFHADVRQLEEQLAVALGEKSKLQRETAAMKRDVESTWAAERIESALFRERINDVTYEVVRITQALESSGCVDRADVCLISPSDRTWQANATAGYRCSSDEVGAPTINTGALVERVRALRTVASRAAAN
jgi:hypothetical protein